MRNLLRELRTVWRDMWFEVGVLAIPLFAILLPAALVAEAVGAVWRNRYLIQGGKDVWEMMKRNETLWAIGFQGFVELRVCTRAPRAFRSQVDKETEVYHAEFYFDTAGRERMRRVKVPHKLALKCSYHTGGKVWKSLPMQ